VRLYVPEIIAIGVHLLVAWGPAVTNHPQTVTASSRGLRDATVSLQVAAVRVPIWRSGRGRGRFGGAKTARRSAYVLFVKWLSD
jgi:hypothetical protein